MNFILFLLSICLMGLALPNEFLTFGSTSLGIIALIPLYLVFIFAKTRRSKAFLFGIWVAIIHLVSSFWLAYFRDFAIFTIGASSIAYFILGLPFGVFIHDFMSSFKSNKKYLRPIAFAIIWTFWEWFKSTGFFAYPWGTIPMTTYNFKILTQITDITGVWGISFLIALLAGFASEIILLIGKTQKEVLISSFKPMLRLGGFIMLLFIIFLSYGVFKLNEPVNPSKKLKVAIIQQNINSWDYSDYDNNLKFGISLTEDLLKSHKEKPDLILWGENSLIYSYPISMAYYLFNPEGKTFQNMLTNSQTPILAGTPVPIDEERNFYTNSVCLISSDGFVENMYSKIHLVPFAEYMPFIEYEFVQNFFARLVGFSSGFLPGTKYNAFDINNSKGENVRFIAPICFEDAFATLCATLHNKNKSELIINLTDDSWSNTRSAEYQHFVVAHFRSIELRTTMIRSTNAGYSCVIDPWGRVIADLPLFCSAGLFVDVPVYKHQQTFYSKYKDWIPLICIFILISFAILNCVHIKNAKHH